MKKATIRIYTDGAGAGPANDQSKIAWIRADTGEKHVEIIKAATNNEAEYLAVISALKPLPTASDVEVVTDSLLIVSQIRGDYRIKEPRLTKLAGEVRTIAERKKLTVKMIWVSRTENRAGKLL
jgi:ribonuclease HI